MLKRGDQEELARELELATQRIRKAGELTKQLEKRHSNLFKSKLIASTLLSPFIEDAEGKLAALNLANFMRTLGLPEEVEQWSLTTLREKLVKIGARIVRHGRYIMFQLAGVAVPHALFAEILRRIHGLRCRPPPLPA